MMELTFYDAAGVLWSRASTGQLVLRATPVHIEARKLLENYVRWSVGKMQGPHG
jgi:hypothetical protein